MRVVALVVVLAALTSCTSRVSERPASVTADERPTSELQMETAMTVLSSQSAVEMTFLDLRRERPPLIQLLFDVVLRNDAPEPRWFLLPAKLSAGSRPAGGVNGIEVFALGGHGRVIVGRFQGNAGFQAVLLPAQAKVIVRRFPIALWEKLPEGPVSVEVGIARSLTIGGEPAEAWFGVDPTSDTEADVTGDQLKRLGSRYTSGMTEVPIVTNDERRVKIQVSLAQTTGA